MCICALFSFFACAFLLFYALFCMHQRVIKFRAPQPAEEHPGILRPPTGVSFNRQLLAIKATKNNTRKIYYPPQPSNSAHCSALNTQLLCLLARINSQHFADFCIRIRNARHALSPAHDYELRYLSPDTGSIYPKIAYRDS